MKNEKLYDAITGIRPDLTDEARNHVVKKSRGARKWWVAGIAVAMAVIIVAGVAIWPGKTPLVSSAYALEEAVYPTTLKYPDYRDYTRPNGEVDDDAWEQAYEAWKESCKDLYVDADIRLADFFTAVSRQLLMNNDKQNTVCSPVNIAVAMGMLAETTGGETRQQILDMMGVDTIEQLREQTSAVWKNCYRDDGTALSVLASSLWLRDGYDYNADTLKQLAETYFASSYKGEMGSEDYNKAFRAWLSEQTGGLLDDQVNGLELDPMTVLALATTVNYQAKWEIPFDPSKTDTGVFHGADHDAEYTFMHMEMHMTYYWGEKFGAIRLSLNSSDRHGNGGMWLLLPDEGVTPEELMNDPEAMGFLSSYNTWSNTAYTRVKLSVPAFDVAGQTDLRDAMKALGVTDVFTDKADFSPLTDEKGIFVGSAPHGVRVTIDEEGCKAAAFTVIELCGAAIPEGTVEFTLDRPFLFAVTTSAGLPLFEGIVNQLGE